ncbi:MAG: hypothetical protein AB8I08_14725 [Sandaracinaceae bacterium]
MRLSVVLLAFPLVACSSAASSSAPPPAEREAPAPVALDEIELPSYPDDASEAVRTCATDYREIAAAPFPERPDGQSFDQWWAGPFQGWVENYNGVRERCDAIQAELPEEGAATQLMWGAQSYMHQRLGQAALPYEEHAQMFMMGRYWTLGAACTYERCESGPDEAWASLCRERGAQMPPCPPVPATAEEAPESAPAAPAE